MLYKRQTVIAAFSSLFMGSLTLFSIFLCAGVLNRNDHLAEWGIADMDIYVSRIRNVDERESGLLEYLDESASVDYYYAAMSDTVFYKTENASGSIMADIYNDQILPNMHVSIVEGHDPDNHDEIAVGMRFAKLNDVVIGDVLEITHGNDTRCMTVSGIYSSFKQYSESVRFLVDDIVTYFDNNADGYYSIVLEGGAVTDAVINELQQKFPDYRFIPMKRGYMNTLINMTTPVLLIVFMCLIVFMFIIRVLLSLFITDRQEALKTYMHVGFSKMNVCKIVRYSILPTVLCAVLLAIPCATIIVPGLFKGVAMELGLSSVPLNTSIVTILAGVLVIVLSARFVFRRRNIIDVLR